MSRKRATCETRTRDTSRCSKKRCATFPQPAFTATHCACLFIDASINTHLSCQLVPPVDRFGPRRSLSRCALSLSMPAFCYDIFPYDMPTFAYRFVLASDRLSYCDRCPVSYSVPRTFLSRSRVSCLVVPHSLPILPVLPSYLHYCPLPYFF